MRYFRPRDKVVCIKKVGEYKVGQVYEIKITTSACQSKLPNISITEDKCVVVLPGVRLDCCHWVHHATVFPCFKLYTNKKDFLPEWL